MRRCADGTFGVKFECPTNVSSVIAAETSFRVGKTALGKGSEAKKADKKHFLRLF